MLLSMAMAEDIQLAPMDPGISALADRPDRFILIP